MTNREIFDFFSSAGFTPEGICALMGNFMAESNMVPNIAQRGMTKLTDAQYTAAADNGLLDFPRDQVGYGYAQWTFPQRKANFLSFAKASGTSVGDPMTQLRFCLKELNEDFPSIAKALTTSHDMLQLAQLVCNVYENPAVKNVGTRLEYAQSFYNELVKGETVVVPPAFQKPDVTVAGFQGLMVGNGYWPYDVDGVKSPTFFSKLREFVDDMEKC